MAERRGFEPPDQFYPINRLAGGCLQPLGHLSTTAMAEGVGFEPTEPCGSAVFKTAALNHSAIPPQGRETIATPAKRHQRVARPCERLACWLTSSPSERGSLAAAVPPDKDAQTRAARPSGRGTRWHRGSGRCRQAPRRPRAVRATMMMRNTPIPTAHTHVSLYQ